MKIQIIGRIGEGKTTMAEYLAEVLKGQVNTVNVIDDDLLHYPEMEKVRRINKENCFKDLNVTIETVQLRRTLEDLDAEV